MPFIRQTRDKRGFEQTVVMHAYHPGGNGPSRPRVIYLFRTPANLKVGRQALDPEVMEALEHTHPDLSFDWQSISREFVAPRPSAPNDRPMRRPPPRPAERVRPAPVQTQVSAPAVVADDASPLGRALGAVEAARLRRRYSELVQRIARRGRTPEERDRLSERVRRLNPDDWPDEAAIRTAVPTVDSAWDAISAELPSRRRGRRGGRRRPEDGRSPSAIMATGGEHGTDGTEGSHDVPQDSQVVVAGAADPDGDVGDFSPEPGTTAGPDPDLPVGD